LIPVKGGAGGFDARYRVAARGGVEESEEG